MGEVLFDQWFSKVDMQSDFLKEQNQGRKACRVQKRFQWWNFVTWKPIRKLFFRVSKKNLMLGETEVEWRLWKGTCNLQWKKKAKYGVVLSSNGCKDVHKLPQKSFSVSSVACLIKFEQCSRDFCREKVTAVSFMLKDNQRIEIFEQTLLFKITIMFFLLNRIDVVYSVHGWS